MALQRKAKLLIVPAIVINSILILNPIHISYEKLAVFEPMIVG